MSFLSKLFPMSRDVAGRESASLEDPLVPVPIPALVALLVNLEKSKGAALSEQEVLDIRDKAACIMLPLSKKRLMDEKRGYNDIDPENVWPEWQALRMELQRDAP